MYLLKQVLTLLGMLEISQGELPQGRECKLVPSYLCTSAPLLLSGW